MRRLLRHLLTPAWILRRRYPAALLQQIEARIVEAERHHPGELRFVAEHALEPGDLFAGVTSRERALELFALLGMWDTARNNGVLIYVLHAEHAVEIVADRALARAVPQAAWDGLCRKAEAQFRAGRHAAGALELIDSVARLLDEHFPGAAGEGQANELPDQPLLL
jgi:uncharacterized membrane protein